MEKTLDFLKLIINKNENSIYLLYAMKRHMLIYNVHFINIKQNDGLITSELIYQKNKLDKTAYDVVHILCGFAVLLMLR